MDILEQLLQKQRFHNDTETPLDFARRYQNMLNNRDAAAFRNVGPQDLTAFPDRNAYQPDSVLQYLMSGNWAERL